MPAPLYDVNFMALIFDAVLCTFMIDLLMRSFGESW